jgi:hypothetical protein
MAMGRCLNGTFPFECESRADTAAISRAPHANRGAGKIHIHSEFPDVETPRPEGEQLQQNHAQSHVPDFGSSAKICAASATHSSQMKTLLLSPVCGPRRARNPSQPPQPPMRVRTSCRALPQNEHLLHGALVGLV